MACNQERLMNLPIKGQYKQKLTEFCSNPANAQACQKICNMTDEQIVEKINKVESMLANWAEKGVPDQLKQGMAARNPEMGAQIDQFMKSPNTKNMVQGIRQQQAQSGIGGIAPQPQAPQMQTPPKPVPPGVPPSQLSRVPMPMDMPSGIQTLPRRRF